MNAGVRKVFPSLSRAPQPIQATNTTSVGTALHYEYIDTASPEYFRTRYAEADAGAVKGGLSARAAVRNSILYELMGIVDKEYAEFEVALRSDRAAKDILVKMVSISLSGVGSLVGGGANTILTQIDLGLKGMSESWDANMLGGKTCELLNNTMRGERAKTEKQIYACMRNEVSLYPLEAGIRDVGEYYRQGFVTAALTKLVEKSAAEARKEAEAAAKEKTK